MLMFIMRRLLLFFPMALLMSVTAFVLIQAPPGIFSPIMWRACALRANWWTRAKLRRWTRWYGLDQPIYVQYGKWIWGVLHWDLGISIEWQRPITELINERLAMTLILGLFTILFTWTLAIPIGILSAVKKYTFIDYTFTFLSYLGVGTPNFLLALVLMWLAFSVYGLKITGLFSEEYIMAPWSLGKVWDMLKHMWIPMLILGTDGTARFTRIMRQPAR
ncbi:MAG: ABC transporter permease [Caldilineaceae bacterium]